MNKISRIFVQHIKIMCNMAEKKTKKIKSIPL